MPLLLVLANRLLHFRSCKISEFVSPVMFRQDLSGHVLRPRPAHWLPSVKPSLPSSFQLPVLKESGKNFWYASYLVIHSQKRQTLLQVVNFTDLLQFVDKVATSSLISSSCNKLVRIRHVATCHLQTCCNLLKQLVTSLWITRQLASSLLTTCNRLVVIKLLQAMRTHPDIGLLSTELLQLARFWLCSVFFYRVRMGVS